jgi:hypothetical protein
MTKKLSVSSRPGKQIRVSAESISNKPLSERQKAALDGVTGRQKRRDASRIDYSDVPASGETAVKFDSDRSSISRCSAAKRGKDKEG